MNDKLNLPKPPEGQFWRIKNTSFGSLVELQLREKFLGIFSLVVESRFIIPDDAAAAFVERVATDLLEERAKRQESVAKSSRWSGEYYR